MQNISYRLFLAALVLGIVVVGSKSFAVRTFGDFMDYDKDAFGRKTLQVKTFFQDKDPEVVISAEANALIGNFCFHNKEFRTKWTSLRIASDLGSDVGPWGFNLALTLVRISPSLEKLDFDLSPVQIAHMLDTHVHYKKPGLPNVNAAYLELVNYLVTTNRYGIIEAYDARYNATLKHPDTSDATRALWHGKRAQR